MLPLGIRGYLLFLWAASLPIHRLPWTLPVPRAGAGEWMFPCALVASAAWLTPSKLGRGALVLPALLAIGFAPSVAFSVDPGTSIKQLGVLLYVVMILLIARQAARNGFGFVVLTGFVAGVIVSTVWAWRAPQYDAWLLPNWPRPIGPTETPNMFAVQTFVAAIAALELWKHASSSSSSSLSLSQKTIPARWLLAVAIALIATAVFTLSHVVAAAFVAAAFALTRITHGRARAVAIAGFVLGVGGLLMSVRYRLLPLSSAPPFLDLRPGFYGPAHTIALEVFAASPIVGVGLECFIKVWPAHDDGSRFAANFAGGLEAFEGPRDPHSTWLGYLAEAGVFGAMVLAGLTALAVRARRGGGRLGLDVALVFAAGSGLVMDLLTNRELALVIGVLIGLPRRKKKSEDAAVAAL